MKRDSSSGATSSRRGGVGGGSAGGLSSFRSSRRGAAWSCARSSIARRFNSRVRLISTHWVGTTRSFPNGEIRTRGSAFTSSWVCPLSRCSRRCRSRRLRGSGLIVVCIICGHLETANWTRVVLGKPRQNAI
ncbi:hypothetical protein Mapa_015027 [Marchantia paleacea]|nr:hypothetical protein Mapa_015027 [Marchantia paleacea]